MSKIETMLSVEEVLELVPGDADNATWINPGFVAVVREITTKTTKTGKEFYLCTLASQTGSATLQVSFFTRPKFEEGDVIEVSGQGLRRTEYNGQAQAAVGLKTEVHVVGKSVHHAEQKQAAATGAPALNGQLQPLNGQTVGMAMKEALALAGMAAGGVTRDVLKDPLFWVDVKTYAGNIIRISRTLERGQLSPPSWPVKAKEAAPEAEDVPYNEPSPKRATAPVSPQRAPNRGRPMNEEQAANLSADGAVDDDVPF